MPQNCSTDFKSTTLSEFFFLFFLQHPLTSAKSVEFPVMKKRGSVETVFFFFSNHDRSQLLVTPTLKAAQAATWKARELLIFTLCGGGLAV